MSYKTYEVNVSDVGNKAWCINGKLHREDGPAIEDSGGNKQWWINGKLHREDGPAIEYSDGDKSWYLNGEKLTEKQWQKKVSPVKELTVEEISKQLGFEVKVVKG